MQTIYKETKGFIFIAIIVSFLAYGASFKERADPVLEEIGKIVADNRLSSDEKVNQLLLFLRKEKEAYWPSVFYYIHKVNENAAEQVALEKFRDNLTSRESKLHIGRFLTQRYKSKGFIKEYSKFLIKAILEGGIEEFCHKREEDKISAIGEYAFIASDFEGYKCIDFEYFKDERVIPALIRGLSAPDKIYGEDSGCVRMGEPGESTGRNVERQQIPIALAKLEAIEAIEPMKSILFTHHDYWLRRHCAYALAYLMKRDESYAIEKRLQEGEGEERQFLFGFGEGLLAKGNSDGLNYMRFEFLPGKDEDFSTILYNAELILGAVDNIKSPNTEPLYAYLISQEGLRNIFLFEKSKIKFRARATEIFNATEEELLKNSEGRIVSVFDQIVSGIITNNLQHLFSSIAGIGKKTQSEKIRYIAGKLSQ